jgi:hypothetical protein
MRHRSSGGKRRSGDSVALIVALWQKFRYVLLRVWREVRLTWSFALSESDSGSATWTVSFCVYPLLPTAASRK